MKKKTYKIIICISLVVMLFTNFTSVFGAINESYSKNTKVTETSLESKIKDSVLLDVLANMINAVASLAESLIGGIFSVLTGDNIFPWADRIIFNSIGFLDINFLNPADSSLFGASNAPSILGKVVKRVYSTIFSLAVLFLGVAVGVMAIRLAISSIAAEKAKYKQAIVNWATCIVLLFLMHYILAFVFWVNEQMVEIASNVLMSTIEKEGLGSVDFQEALNSVLSPEERINEFVNANAQDKKDQLKTYKDTFDANPEITSNLLTNSDYCPPASNISKNAVGRLFNAALENETSEGFWKFVGGTDDYMLEISSPVLKHDVEDAVSITKKDADTYQKESNNGKFTATHGTIFPNTTKGREAFKASDDYKQTLAWYVTLVGNYVYGSSGQIMGQSTPVTQWNALNDFQYLDIIYEKINYLPSDDGGYWTLVSDSEKSDFMSRFSDKFGSSRYVTDANASECQKYIYNNSSVSDLEKILGNSIVNYAIKYRLKVDQAIIGAASNKTAVNTSANDIIANLGAFFKQSAYVYTTETKTTDEGGEETKVTGWRASKLSVTGALLYGIFIFQSCMYLIMYVKRLFYVIMLSMFGPIVVIYDFFMKSAS